MARKKIPLDRDAGDFILERTATSELGLQQILNEWNVAYPNKTLTVWNVSSWRMNYPGFSEDYREAKEVQADLLGEKLLGEALSDRTYIMVIEEKDPSGKVVKRTEKSIDNVNRSRVLCDNIIRRMTQLAPNKYGKGAEDAPKNGMNASLRNVVDAIKASPTTADEEIGDK